MIKRKLLIGVISCLITTLAVAQTYPMDGSPIDDCSGFFADSGGNNDPYSANENLTTTICPDFTTGTHIQLVFSGVELMAGDELCFFDGDDACDPEVTTISCFIPDCTMMLDTSFTIAPTCYNTADGFAFMSASNAASPVEYFLDGAGPPSGPGLSGVSSGPHTVIAIDAAGCSDTMSFIMPSPDSILLDLVIDSINCFGFSDGMATASATGGTGLFSYVWNTVPATFDQTVANLSMGTYTVTASDANNCTATAVAEMTEPAILQATLTQDSVNCNAGNDGTATASPFGGTAPYTFVWDNGQSTATAIDLIAGTYEVTISDANSCSEIIQIDVLEPAPIMVTLLADSVNCFGASDGMLTCNYIGGVGQATFSWSGPGAYTSTDQNPGGLAEGNYCVTVTDANNCTATQCLDVNAPAAIDLMSSSTTPLCVGSDEGTATITPSGGSAPYSYLWADGQNTQVASSLNAGDIGVTVTDANGCTSEAIVTVDAAPPIVLVMDSAATSCANTNDGTVSVSASGGLGSAFGYLWDNNTGSQTSDTAFNLIPGNYCVTVSDNNGCTASDCISITSPDAIVIETATEMPVSCFGLADGQAQVTVTGGTGPGTYSYLWDDSNAQFQNPAVFLAADTYTVTVSDANGCTEVASIEVTQPDTLTITTSVTDVNCFEGNDGTATVVPEGGTMPYAYNWSDFQTTATAENLTAAFYGITVTDDNGCTAISSVSIDQPATGMSTTIAQTSIGCFGAEQGEALIEATGGTAGYTFEWSDGSVNDLAQGLDTGFYSVTVTDALGCTMEDTLTIVELEEVTINIAFVEPDCYDQSSGQLGVNIVNGGVGGGDPDNYTYVWNTTPPLNTAYIDNIPGGMSYEVTVTDAQGCSAVEEIFLDQPDELSVSLDITDAACAALSNGMVEITNVVSSNAPFTYAWDANAGNQTTATATDLPAGTYAVTITDALGCSTDTMMLVAEPEPLEFTFETTGNLCNGDTIGTIQSSASGGTPAYTYDWSNGLTGENLTGLQTGAYIVTITDANSCELIDTVHVIQPVSVSATFETEDVTCFGDQDGSAIIQVEGGAAPYTYSFDGDDFNGVTTVVGLSADDYEVVIMDANGCTFTSTVSIGGPPEVMVDAGEDITLGLGEQATLSATTTNAVGDIQISWSAPYLGTLFCPDSTENCANPLTTTQNTINYEVYVVDANGCEATDDVTVFVEKKRPVFVPTAFTPNNDAINSLLTVHGRTDTEVMVFRVFDRWGTMVYEARDFMVGDLQTGWDGTFKGKLMQPGVYVWYLEARFIDGFETGFEGHTTLLR